MADNTCCPGIRQKVVQHTRWARVFNASLGNGRYGTHLCEGDAVVAAHIQGAAELTGLHQQLHALLMLPMLQEEVSCSMQKLQAAMLA